MKPCPFCGREDSTDNAVQESAILLVQGVSPMRTRRYRVECLCGVCGPWKADPREAEMVWETRA